MALTLLGRLATVKLKQLLCVLVVFSLCVLLYSYKGAIASDESIYLITNLFPDIGNYQPYDWNYTITLTAQAVNVTECLIHVSQYINRPSTCTSFGPAHIFEKSNIIAVIPAKTGSSLFQKKLLEKINKSLDHQHKLADLHHGAHTHFKSSIEHNGIHKQLWDQIETQSVASYVATYFCDANYNKIFIYRDPLERLLSGFLDKCTESAYKYCENWHSHCQDYLLTVGINKEKLKNKGCKKYKTMSAKAKEELIKDNTLLNFVKWILDTYKTEQEKCSVDQHFRSFYLFNDFEYFQPYFNTFHLKDTFAWDYLMKSILDPQYYPKWYGLRSKNFKPDGSKKTAYHDMHSDDKIFYYFPDVQTVYWALVYTWKDYHLFEWKLPEWICEIIEKSDNKQDTDMLIGLIQDKLKDKSDLWPSCVDTVD